MSIGAEVFSQSIWIKWQVGIRNGNNRELDVCNKKIALDVIKLINPQISYNLKKKKKPSGGKY